MTAKSDRLEKLMSDPDLKEAFENVREHYKNAMCVTPLNDEGDKITLKFRTMLQLLNDVEYDLHQAIQEGQVEDFNAVEQERQSLIGRTLDGIRNKH